MNITTCFNGIKTRYTFLTEKECLAFWNNQIIQNHNLEGRSLDLNKRQVSHIGNSIL